MGTITLGRTLIVIGCFAVKFNKKVPIFCNTGTFSCGVRGYLEFNNLFRSVILSIS